MGCIAKDYKAKFYTENDAVTQGHCEENIEASQFTTIDIKKLVLNFQSLTIKVEQFIHF